MPLEILHILLLMQNAHSLVADLTTLISLLKYNHQ